MFYSSKKIDRDTCVKEYFLPQRIMKTVGDVANAEALLTNEERKIRFACGAVTFMTTTAEQRAGILLDFGFEMCGGISLSVFDIKDAGTCKLRLSFGESANEALSHIGEKNATNDHSPRDFEIDASMFSTLCHGETGFRFVYIELITQCRITVTALQGVCVYKDYEFIGSFESSDKDLNDIYNTAAHTCHLCMQNGIFDGIKRDRLVWIGDLYPEMITIKYLFGNVPDVNEALYFSAQGLPDGVWINSIPTYDIWWVVVTAHWAKYFGDDMFIRENVELVNRIIGDVVSGIDENGVFIADDFVDWPTRMDREGASKEGVKALTMMFYDAVKDLGKYVDKQLRDKCSDLRKKLKSVECRHCNFKQVAALLLFTGLEKKESKKFLADGDVRGYSTFMSYFIYSALSKVADEKTVFQALKKYYGAMLDLGATTFWEDFDIDWAENACRIDEICPEGKSDVHGDNGKFCYEGFRHSLCHGWSSGPVAFITEYVLGINVVGSGCKKIRLKPHLDTLSYAKGSIATPYGKFSVSYKRDKMGNIAVKYKAPKEIEVEAEV